MDSPNAVALTIPPEALTPVIEQTVAAVLAQLRDDGELLPAGPLAWPEAQAAAMLSLAPHQLRDLRLREEIMASCGPGRKILYSRSDLLNFLAARRWSPSEERRAKNRK